MSSTITTMKKDMKPLVSILIPAYNAENWIASTIKSAVDQTWPNKEIIVIDDGSTDKTAEIARRFSAKNVKIVSTENRGLPAAVNYAYQLSQGDYIQELDSDDLLAPDKIEKQLAGPPRDRHQAHASVRAVGLLLLPHQPRQFRPLTRCGKTSRRSSGF